MIDGPWASGAALNPVIEITPQLGVGLFERVPERLRTLVYGAISGGWAGTRYFAADGLRHDIARVIPLRPIGPIARLLGATIYNPSIVVRVEYEAPRSYTLHELRDALIDALNANDDILTQRRDAAELGARFRDAETFTDLVRTLRYAGVSLGRVADR